MSTMWVQMVLRKWRSWLTTITVPSKSSRKSSSQFTALMSRLLVGSSSSRMSGLPNRAWASSTFTFSRASRVAMSLEWNSVPTPRPWRMRLASLSASQPPSSAYSSSSSQARMPSASVISSLA